MELIFNKESTKANQLAELFREAIGAGVYAEGQALPSINELSKLYSVSRDTVFKAFNELRRDGLIDSLPTKGYYVRTHLDRILLLLDTYTPFKRELYEAITNVIGPDCTVDLYFHNYNEERFNRIVEDSADRYNLYLIMNYRNDKYSDVLDKLEHTKVLLLDFGRFEKDRFSYLCQGFDTTLYAVMASGLPLFRKYRRIVFVFPPSSEHPRSSVNYFGKFCSDFGLNTRLPKISRSWRYVPALHILLQGIRT